MRIFFFVRDCHDREKELSNSYKLLWDPQSILDTLKPHAKFKPIKQHHIHPSPHRLTNQNNKTTPPDNHSPHMLTILSGDVSCGSGESLLDDWDRRLVEVWRLRGGSVYRRSTGMTAGRMYEVGGGLQGVSNKGLKLLLGGTGQWDIDMSSAHPTILAWLIGKNASPTLSSWVNDKTSLYGEDDPKAVKEDFLAVLNGRRRPRTFAGILLKKEMPNIIRELRESGIVTGKWRRDTVFRVCEALEDEILRLMKEVVERLGCTVSVLKFDGMVIDPRGAEDVLETLEDEIEARFPGLNMQLKIKQVF